MGRGHRARADRGPTGGRRGFWGGTGIGPRVFFSGTAARALFSAFPHSSPRGNLCPWAAKKPKHSREQKKKRVGGVGDGSKEGTWLLCLWAALFGIRFSSPGPGPEKFRAFQMGRGELETILRAQFLSPASVKKGALVAPAI